MVDNYVIRLEADDKWIITGIYMGIFIFLALSVSCSERLLLFKYVGKRKHFHLFYAYHLLISVTARFQLVVFLNHDK